VNAALIAVQLEIDAGVLATPASYRQHLEDAAARAIAAGGAADVKLLVFPELAGHLALLALAPPQAHRAKTLGAAIAAAAIRRPFEVLRGVATTRVLQPRHAVLAALAPDGERFWRNVFGPLARGRGAYVIAGSHLRLTPSGELTNASLTFAPDGRCVATTEKVNLVPGMEDGAPGALGLARGSADRVPIVDTPAGRLCTLICYDAFCEPHTSLERFVPMGAQNARRGGVAIAANPAANPWRWTAAWPPASLAGGVERAPGTRAAQWAREGLRASLTCSPGFARWGVTAHLVGRVLDLEFDGASEIVEHAAGEARVVAAASRHDRGDHVVATIPC
jgi:predicted amidohydrolase